MRGEVTIIRTSTQPSGYCSGVLASLEVAELGVCEAEDFNHKRGARDLAIFNAN